eukprot:359013-Chlamydomonas_euryale.AAC.2
MPPPASTLTAGQWRSHPRPPPTSIMVLTPGVTHAQNVYPPPLNYATFHPAHLVCSARVSSWKTFSQLWTTTWMERWTRSRCGFIPAGMCAYALDMEQIVDLHQLARKCACVHA